jgi:hypothetical protein
MQVGLRTFATLSKPIAAFRAAAKWSARARMWTAIHIVRRRRTADLETIAQVAGSTEYKDLVTIGMCLPSRQIGESTGTKAGSCQLHV